MLKGGCFCGQIRYEAGGKPFHETICHCTICRGTTGAPMVAWFSVARGDLRVVAGKLARFRSSAKAVRSFCPNCGAHLTFEYADFPQEIDVATATLDDANAAPPRDHTWTQSKLVWVKLADGLPQFPRGRTGRVPGT